MKKHFKSSPVIIIGMHRSGTTMLSKLIESAGFFDGFNKDANNESKFIIKKNDQLLELSNCTWENPFKYIENIGSQKTKDNALWLKNEFLSKKSIKHFGNSRWIFKRLLLNNRNNLMFKDPRFSITLQTWLELFPNLRIIHIKRHGIDVAESLRNRAKKDVDSGKILKKNKTLRTGSMVLDLNHGIHLWDFYETQCTNKLNRIDKENKISIKYEDLLCNTEKTLRDISVFLKTDLLKTTEDDFKKDRAFSYLRNEALSSLAINYKNILRKHGY